jgi:integrase
MRLRQMVREGQCPCNERDAAKAKHAIEVREAEACLFSAVVADYAKQHLKGLKSGTPKLAMIDRERIPHWGSRNIADITDIDVKRRIQAVKDTGKCESARVLGEIIRALFNWAMEQPEYRLTGRSPCATIKIAKLVGKKIARTRVLSEIEIRALWRAAEWLGYPYGKLVRALLLTALRRNEAARAEWREFNLAAGLWIVPASRMKGAAVSHVVPLTPDIIALLQSLPRVGDGRFVFVGSTGGAIGGFSPFKKKLDDRMLVELQAIAEERGEDPSQVTVEPFTLHDIRRTVRTQLSALAVPVHICERILAHVQTGVIAIYDQHRYTAEKKAALELWHQRLRSIITPSPDNVVPLKSRA